MQIQTTKIKKKQTNKPDEEQVQIQSDKGGNNNRTQRSWNEKIKGWRTWTKFGNKGLKREVSGPPKTHVSKKKKNKDSKYVPNTRGEAKTRPQC